MLAQVETVEDYDLYCHYVAGLVGIGLSQLFSASGRESPELASSTELANHMGLFLQKTNIIRDYLVRPAVLYNACVVHSSAFQFLETILFHWDT